MNIFQVKPELAVQRNTRASLIVYENTKNWFGSMLFFLDFDSLDLAVEGHVWNSVFLDFEHFIARFTWVRINRVARRGPDGEDAMNFVC